ncbi:MAG: hypothetical protein ACO1SV_09805 [Fimbriimonas sp.]
MAKLAVSVFMDVEDPVNPAADDAALDFASLFSEVGIRGSFCLTGDKCRTLLERGRLDVADAYRPHCLGLHTNGHSRHPSTMELLADLSFEDGCVAAYDEELKGFEAFQNLLGQSPTFWGGAGNTWSPEITDALKRLGIPAFTYALTAVPNHAVHHFNGLVALPQTVSVGEDVWADDPAVGEEALARIRDFEGPWLGVFVGHPTRFRHVDYWDLAYYAGQTPPEPVLTAEQSPERYDDAKGNLRRFLIGLQEVATVIGVDEALALPWEFRAPSEEERAFFRERTAERIRNAARWPIHRPDLDPENIVAKTLALEDTVAIGTA